MNRCTVIVDEKGLSFLEKGQLWMYRNNLVSIGKEAEDGCIADIMSESGKYVATGFLSTVSHVVVRILSTHQDEEIDRSFFERRIREAWRYRCAVERENLSNCRIIYGDADGLPGLVVDRYNDVLSVQMICKGMEVRKDMLYGILKQVLAEDGEVIHGIYERFDVKARLKEGLEVYKGRYGNGAFSFDQIISENGLKLHVDIENGQKTGYFLDQKNNRLLVRHLSYGMRVLDCFTHTGGFALNAALGGATAVTAVDVSSVALEEGKANAKLNGLKNVSFVQADVFDYLDTLSVGDFDFIILDPPAFTKSRRTIDHAYHGYLSINEKAMHVLRKGGYLATCSCSRYMDTALFEKMLREAAVSAGVILKQISVTQQNGDHPVLWPMEETSYLKFFMFQVLEKR